jgi:hypothetical protein
MAAGWNTGIGFEIRSNQRRKKRRVLYNSHTGTEVFNM